MKVEGNGWLKFAKLDITPTGKSKLSFLLTRTLKRPGKPNIYEDFPCEAWGEPAEKAAEWIQPPTNEVARYYVGVKGFLKSDKFTNKTTGAKVRRLVVLATEIKKLKDKGEPGAEPPPDDDIEF